MKIKSLLVCFLAVAALSLTSCKKENYAEKFVGTYNASVTPELTISVPAMETEEVIEGETLEGLTFTISQVGDTQDVNIVFPLPEFDEEDMDMTELGIELPQSIVLGGTCDETGLHINGLALNQTLPIEDLGMSIAVNITIGNATIADPASMSWTQSVSGTINITMAPIMEGMPEMTFDGTISGGIKFNATKQ
ncbi:MAG: hypothetical protein IKM23_09210 [Bacteroidales bacterium]|nr:hypothetical protein [Bacteroidales bacterium]